MREAQHIRRLANTYEELEEKLMRGEVDSELVIKKQHHIMEKIKELTELILNNKK